MIRRWTLVKQRRKHLACTLALITPLLIGAPRPIEAASDDGAVDLSLEALSNLRLTGMSMTNIHHVHDKGEWMVSYQFMRMGMEGNLVGSSSVTSEQIHDDYGYPVAPEHMDMNTHMFGAMYGVTDWMTVMAMIPYKSYGMDLEAEMMGNHVHFTTESSGVGDLGLSAFLSAYRDEVHRLVVELYIGFPTGSIDETGTVPMNGGMTVVLGYPMQLGTGSYSMRPGITYLGQSGHWMWGGHFDARVQLDMNDRGYKVGEQYTVNAWASRLLLDWLSVSLRPEFLAATSYDGADARLNPAIAPTNDPALRGGERLDFLFGLNVFGTEGWTRGQRLAFEGGIPAYQSLDGPQLEVDYRFVVTWNWIF